MAPLPVDDVGAAIGESHHISEEFSGILKIGIDHEDAFTMSKSQSCGKRDLMTVVPGQVQLPVLA